jgi:uncharacterized membrane protein YkoI
MKTGMTLLAMCLATIGAAMADSDHDRARRAVEQGLILPFKDILAKVQQAYPGQILKAELDDEDGTLVYELKILSGDGRVVEVVFDARTGELLKAKGLSPKR